jgi:hypothetical protein
MSFSSCPLNGGAERGEAGHFGTPERPIPRMTHDPGRQDGHRAPRGGTKDHQDEKRLNETATETP